MTMRVLVACWVPVAGCGLEAQRLPANAESETNAHESEPRQPPEFATGGTAVPVDTGDHLLRIRSDGSIAFQVEQWSGASGSAASRDFCSRPRTGRYVAIAAGAMHTLAIDCDGSLWAWGYNSMGQLGDGTTMKRGLPVKVGEGFAA